MTTQEKVALLANAFIRRGRIKNEGETNGQFVTRIVTDRMAKFKKGFLEKAIEEQLKIENPLEAVDVSDL